MTRDQGGARVVDGSEPWDPLKSSRPYWMDTPAEQHIKMQVYINPSQQVRYLSFMFSSRPIVLAFLEEWSVECADGFCISCEQTLSVHSHNQSSRLRWSGRSDRKICELTKVAHFEGFEVCSSRSCLERIVWRLLWGEVFSMFVLHQSEKNDHSASSSSSCVRSDTSPSGVESLLRATNSPLCLGCTRAAAERRDGRPIAWMKSGYMHPVKNAYKY